MCGRQSQLEHFAAYALPVVALTAECRCPDFVAPAKARGWPPFAVLLHGLARASLEVEPFRQRLDRGRVQRVERLTAGYTVQGAEGQLNFSHVPYSPDFATFLEAYLADREAARQATALRHAPDAGLGFIYVTCLPWLRFTSFQNPYAGRDDDSIPRFAVGRFAWDGGDITFPLAVQAHHGLVDGVHIHQLFVRLAEVLAMPFPPTR